MKKILYCLILIFFCCIKNMNAQNNKDTLYVLYDIESDSYSIEVPYPVPIFLMKTSLDSLINQDVFLYLYVEFVKNEQNDSIYFKEIKELYFNIMHGQITGVFRDGILCSTKNKEKKDLIQKFYTDVEYFVRDIINTHVIINNYPFKTFYIMAFDCKFILKQ